MRTPKKTELPADLHPILRAMFNVVSPLEPSDFEPLLAMTRYRSLAKGEHFCRAGESLSDLGIVIKGLFKVYYLANDGTQSIRRFAEEGTPIGDLSSLISSDLARVSVEAIEASTIALIPYQALEGLYAQHPRWQLFGRRLAEAYCMILEHREHQFLELSATERYQAFHAEKPGLEARVSKADLASFLGITPVSLSRILSAKR